MADGDGADFPPGRWHGRFVWTAGGNPNRHQVVLLRRRFDLDAVPGRGPARAFADARYACWVNGTEVSRGPIRSQVRRKYYDPFDLAPHLRVGANAVAIMALRYALPAGWWMNPAPTLFGYNPLDFGAVVFEARVGDQWWTTDDSWRASTGDAWGQARRDFLAPSPDEILDARELPAGWREVDFDDSAWPAAATLTPVHAGHHRLDQPPLEPFGMLVARPLGALGGDRVTPRSITVRAGAGADPQLGPVDQVVADEATVDLDGAAGGVIELGQTVDPGDGVSCVTADFGGVVCGGLELDLDAPAGAQVDLAGSDSLTDDGRLDVANQRTGLRYTARGHDDTVDRFDPMGLAVARLSVRSPGGPVTIRGLAVRERLAPRPDGPFFRCSDPRLDRIWEIGRRTVDLCAHDAYIDCPTREHRSWTGDAVVHQSVDLATNPDWRLARWHPQLTAAPRSDGMIPMSVAGDIESIDAVAIPDWPLHWVASIHNLYRYTGDRDLVASLLPAAEQFLRWFEPFARDDGLVGELTGWVLVDWASVELDGASAAVNALRVRALRHFAELADWLEDRGRGRWAHARADAAAAGFEQFWDPERGLYADSLVDRRRGRVLSQHSNASAVLAGLVPEDRVAGIVDAICDPDRVVRASWTHNPAEWPAGARDFDVLRETMPEPWWDTDRQVVAAQPFFRSVVHDAVATAGQPERIAGLCLDWQGFVDDGHTTWPETWHSGTRCHGWSSTPTRDLVAHTVGISPAEPSFGVARVAPSLGQLDWAEAAAPTPHGLLRVRADGSEVTVDTPVPVRLDLGDDEERTLEPGSHTVTR